MTFDPLKFRAFDLETHKIQPGLGAPPIVCGSRAWLDQGDLRGEILTKEEAVQAFRGMITEGCVVAGANIAFDLACLAVADDTMLPLIFRAIRAEQIYDVQLAMALDAIGGGHLGLDPRTGDEMRDPSTNKVSKRYSLATCVDMVLDRKDAKALDAWRISYALLDGVPIEDWPDEARDYPVADARNTLEVALAQLRGWPRGDVLQEAESGPARNLNDMAAQVEAAFCLHLGACWGLRSDPERVEKLAAEVDQKHAEAVERFQKIGWVRKDGSEDQVAVKRAIALAYGVTGTCPRCGGSGLVRPIKQVECRGTKLRARYQGCSKTAACICTGTGLLEKPGAETTCKGQDGGCDGTKLDLATAPMLPRSDKGGVKTDRDAAMESGDDDVADYSDNIFEKTRVTYIPYLRKGLDRPLRFSPNAIVATGRCSYEGSPVHQFPRKGGVRECIVARPGRVFASTDYAAGELCTLAQVTLWVVGHSKMAEIINSTEDPGALHTFFAAKMLGRSFDEVKALVKAGDKQAKATRQAAKAGDFGLPGGMGSPKFVLSKRKKSEGTTKTPDYDEKQGTGIEYAGIRFCILLAGAERCGTEKITRWGNRSVSPVCKACVEVVEDVLKPVFFDTYPEVREYLNWISEKTEEDGVVPQIAWNEERGEIEVLRRRGGCAYCDGANTMFQGLLADIGKRAYCQMTREGYLGVKDDGSPSPLVGARFPLFAHDEPFAELFEETAHLSAPRIADIMVLSGKRLAPDVFWKADPALSRMMSKDAEPVHVDGQLMVWEPKAA